VSPSVCRRILLPHIVRLQQLVAVDGLVVLNALLRDGQFITLKVCPAVRAARAVEQLLAERRAGHMFLWHPTMITVLAISRNAYSGNFTTVTQWAGYSLQDLMDDPAWWRQPLIVRAIVAQRVARCIFTGLAKMHAAVSGGWCCFLPGSRGVSVHMCMMLVQVVHQIRAVAVADTGGFLNMLCDCLGTGRLDITLVSRHFI
jgi:hypothetical protein